MADIVCAFISVQRCIFSRCKDILALCQLLTVKLNLWPVGKTLLYLWRAKLDFSKYRIQVIRYLQ